MLFMPMPSYLVVRKTNFHDSLVNDSVAMCALSDRVRSAQSRSWMMIPVCDTFKTRRRV
jgi:hypothetical protein